MIEGVLHRRSHSIPLILKNMKADKNEDSRRIVMFLYLYFRIDCLWPYWLTGLIPPYVYVNF